MDNIAQTGLLIVSGLSGSGKSSALHALEDMGYYCTDNLPASLLLPFITETLAVQERDAPRAANKAAVGIDARNPGKQLSRFESLVEDIRARGVECRVLFLEADDATLLKRFSETRRKHPLSGQGVALAEALRRERELLATISALAEWRIDSSQMNVHTLRDTIRSRLAASSDNMSLLLQSFGYKNGVPGDADFVFDVRCLPNPHWESQLRDLTGMDTAVREFLEAQPMVHDMLNQLETMLLGWLPRFAIANRAYMTVAVGCTGGQHRSVYTVERIATRLRERFPNTMVRHRELS